MQQKKRDFFRATTVGPNAFEKTRAVAGAVAVSQLDRACFSAPKPRACFAGRHRDSWEMFTGLIEEVGTVISSRNEEGGRQLEVAAVSVAGKIQVGGSVAVNGCCLTVTSRRDDRFIFDLLQESLVRTNLRNLQAGSRVNLETALAAGAPLGGHFVQGHIDCAAPILSLKEAGADLRLEIALPNEFAHYVIPKGSIAIDGISLTVAEVLPNSFAVWIIPHTRTQTNLAAAKSGDLVNLEFDLLAKYVERMLNRSPSPPA